MCVSLFLTCTYFLCELDPGLGSPVQKQGPAGINGSRGPPGPPGPEVTEGSVDLSDHCSVSTSQCTITNPGERSCSTPGKVLSHVSTLRLLVSVYVFMYMCKCR